MDVFFQDPHETRLPPHQVRIRALTVEPYPDGRRARLSVEVDPFEKRPSFDIVVRASNGDEVVQTTIIETMTRRLEVTLHLRLPVPPPQTAFTAIVTLFYAPQVSPEDPRLPERTIVDQREITFDLPVP